MKKLRFLPLILALSLPLAGCSFDDLMFWKKKDNTPDTPSQTDKTVNGIIFVHVPSKINKNETLDPETVKLDLSYSDGTSGEGFADRISLDTSTVGTKEGVAFYGAYYKSFTIEVVEPTPARTVTGIKSVTAPSTIEQGKTLDASQVSLVLTYSDGTEEGAVAETVTLVTTTAGPTVGTAYYGGFSKEFSIEVVAPPTPSERTVTGIKSVTAPPTIEQGETLSPSSVSLVLTYSDDTEGDAVAENISLVTSNLGVVKGMAFYGSFSKEFTIEVVEKGGGDTSKTLAELTKIIVEDHNYRINIESYYQEHPEEHFETFLENINDDVYYGLDPYYPNLWESGYIKVKDQGIASFKKGLNSDEIVLQQFVSTNKTLGMHDVFGEMIEYIFETDLITVSENHWKVTNQDLVGMFGTFSGIEDMRLFSNPAQIDIVKDGNKLQITGIYSLTYIDEETGDPTTDHLYVDLDVDGIGTTTNAVYEEFARATSSQLPNPTAWDEEANEDFEDYYNEYVPPFIQGASYALHEATQWNGLRQKYEIKVEDLACGDLRTNYVAQLSAQGYELLGDNVYIRRIENEDHTLADIYRAEISYRAPSESYGGKTIGYFYPNGVFSITYIMYTELISAVENVGELNAYLDTTAAKDILPRFSTDFASSKVAGFEDRTVIANQNVKESEYGYIFTSGPSKYFNIYIANYEDAVSFCDQLVTAAAAKGFTNVSPGVAMLPLKSMSDIATSYISITDLSLYTKTSYEAIGYLQCRICIYDNYNIKYNVDYDDSDPGVSSVTRVSSGYSFEPGETVTFKVNIVDGYEIDTVSSNAGVEFALVSETESSITYSFVMPNQNITVVPSTRSKAASEGLVYDFEYKTFVYTSNNVAYESETMPADTPYSRLILVFHEDGTGTYTRIKYGSNSTTPQQGGTYTVPFSYSLIDGKFIIVATKDNNDNALFDKWRMWTNSNKDNDNDLGSFDENTGIITIGVYDSSNNTREIHLK